MSDRTSDFLRVILVTGPSGAGRSTAINSLEDLGYEAIDNIPIRLIPRLLDGQTAARPMALGLDIRNRDFEPQRVLEIQAELAAMPGLAPEILFLDCSAEVLLRRYSETRRRHPMSPEAAPLDGIEQEIALLDPLRREAETLIETTEMTPHDLSRDIQELFGLETGQTLAVSVQSFSYKRGLPRGADMVLDCRFLNNPYWEPKLRKLTGQSSDVAAYVARDDRFAEFTENVLKLATFQLPACVSEGKAHFSIAFGCTGGQHRSVAVAEFVAEALAQQGWRVSTRHRELEQRGLVMASPAKTH